MSKKYIAREKGVFILLEQTKAMNCVKYYFYKIEENNKSE